MLSMKYRRSIRCLQRKSIKKLKTDLIEENRDKKPKIIKN